MDLLYRSDLHSRIGQSIKRIADELNGVCAVAVGYPGLLRLSWPPTLRIGRVLPLQYFGVDRGGEIIAEHRKCSLPNYEVFDERRYSKLVTGLRLFHSRSQHWLIGL